MLSTLLLPLLASVAGALQPPQLADVILAQEQALMRAVHARDRRPLQALLAEDYVLRSLPDVPRETWIENAMTLCWGERSDITEYAVRELNGAAVATFVLTFYVDPATCRPATLRSLITDVWRRGNEGWQLTLRHSAPASGAGVAGQYGAVPELPPTWDVKGELTFLATAGNASTRTLGLANDVAYQAGRWRTRARAALLTNEVEAVTRARSVTASARQSASLTPRAELFGRLEYARDRFAGIENRTTFEIGSAFPVALPRGHRLTVDTGFGVTSERRLDSPDLRFAVGTGTFAYVWRIAPGTDLRDDLALTADLGSGRNWRGTNALAITVVLTRLLSLKASQALEYRHVPVPGFRRTDVRSAVSLVLAGQQRPGTR